MPNIEIKALYPDLAKARRIAKGLNAWFKGRDRQVDTYFVTRKGRFKLRESTLGGAELIPYLRPDRRGPKKCDYAVIPVQDAPKVKKLLKALLGTDEVVEKQRDIYLVGNVRVHLDQVKGLGNFLELEAVYQGDTSRKRAIEESKARKLLEIFEVPRKNLLENSYREISKRGKKRTSGFHRKSRR